MRTSIPAVVLLLLALVPPLAAHSAPAHACAPVLTFIARGEGAPDDVVVDGARVIFGDLNSNALLAEQGGRVTTLATGLLDPEGIVLWPHHRAVVAEQNRNQLDLIDLTSGRRRVLLSLVNATDAAGVDGIGAAPNGGIYIPDSPNGRLLLLDARHRVRTLATGLGRPVDAVGFRGGVAVADENDHAVWLVKDGTVRRLATLNIPDDLVVMSGRLLATTLGDTSIWEVYPQVRPLVTGLSEPQGLAALPGHALVVADSKRNALYRITGFWGCTR